MSAARRRAWQIGAAGVFAAIVAVVLVLVLSASTTVDLSDLPQQSRAVERTFDGIPQGGFELGRATAPATLIEFADPQCPFCGEFARDTLPQLVRRYVRPGRMRIRLELLTSLGEDSDRIGGLVAGASLQNRAYQLLELAYENQGDEGSHYATDDYLRRIARATPGLDAAKALREASSSSAQRALDRADAAADRVGVTATPAFYVQRRERPPVELQPSSRSADAFRSSLAPYIAHGCSACAR